MTLLENIELISDKKPHAPAIIMPKYRVTWRDLNKLILNYSSFLSFSGVKRGDVIGIDENRPLMNLLASLACMRLGVSFVDVPRNEKILSQIQEKLEVTHVISNNFDNLPSTNIINVRDLRTIMNFDSNFEKSQVELSNFSFIVKTSGTTGNPKFVGLSNEIMKLRFSSYGFYNTDIFWSPVALNFFSSKLRYFSALTEGSTIVLGCGLNGHGINFLNSMAVTKLFCTPSQLHKLIEIGIPLPKCHSIQVTSSFVSEKLRREFKEKINENLYVAYGTTEVGIVTEADPNLQIKLPDTVGTLYPKTDIQVVNQNDVVVSVGTPGIIRIKSPGMCHSYLNDPEMSKINFREGWFYPGDLGYFDSNSALFLLGRSDDMMICDGVNIHPTEIERVLSQHNQVIEVAAFSVAHEKYGEIPVAAVILKDKVSENELIQFCYSELGARAPRKIIFTEDFPRNGMGKVLRQELKSTYARI